MNLGLPQFPEWMLKTIAYLALIGAGALWFGACLGVAYLIRHLHWIP